MKKSSAPILGTTLAAALALLSVLPASAQYVTVGNPGNPNDPSDGDSNTAGVQNYGAVATVYAIGTYEVTLNQYAAFLTAKAAADPLGLYNPSMGTDLNSRGISRTGGSGSYVYGIIGDGQRPVAEHGHIDLCGAGTVFAAAGEEGDGEAANLGGLALGELELLEVLGDGGAGFLQGAGLVRPPHSPTPVPVLTVSGAAGARAIS